MGKINKSVWFALLVCACVATGARAQTINAASCNETDVAAALALITTDGTTVVVPAGDCVWASTLNYLQTHSFTLQGAGAISYSPTSISGIGTDKTIIEDNTKSSSAGSIMNITTIAGKSLRITGFAFTQSPLNTTQNSGGHVNIGGKSTSVRIDHNHINQLNNVDLVTQGAIEGVIDHNQFDGGFADENLTRFLTGQYNNDPTDDGNVSWADTSHFGSSHFMFIETNNFETVPSNSTQHTYAYDCGRAGRFVFRYNTVGYHVELQTHGTGNSSDPRGCRAHEIYNNTFNYSPAPTGNNSNTYGSFLEDLESGSGLFYNNTVFGFPTVEREDTVRTNKATYSQKATPNGWGFCASSPINGVPGPSPWDGNTDATGYPCIDQVGRGKGDLLTVLFPAKVDSVTGTITWPHQAADPWYIWSVTFTPVMNLTNGGLWVSFDTVTVENRDYYLQLPNFKEPATFNGTAGIGVGLLSARPATCTVNPVTGFGVGYFATDTNTLYVCMTTNNNWTVYYTPFTYPHPLVSNTPVGNPPTPPVAQPH